MIDIIKIIGVMLFLGLSMAAVKWFEYVYKPRPEFSRKAIHVIMGTATLSFPWLFDKALPVIVLGILSLLMLLTVRFLGALKNSVGSIFYGVGRDSLGEIFFPISIVVLFCLSKDNKVFYLIPMLMLTFADSIAALIGSSYGRNNLASEQEDTKSLEGTVVFFNVAFTSTIAPLLLFTNIGRAETLLISLIMGILVALIEVISFGGIDNLFIPLLGYAFLILHKDLSVERLVLNIILIAILYCFAYFWNKKASISRLGVAEGLVVAYLIIILGGWIWVIAPITLFITYSIFPRLIEVERKSVMNYHIVASNVAVGLLCAWMASIIGTKQLFFYGFTCAFACHLAMNTYIRFSCYMKRREIESILFAFTKAILFIIVPGVFIYKFGFGSSLSIYSIIIELFSVLIAIIINTKLKKYVHYEIVCSTSAWANSITVLILTVIAMTTKFLMG